MGVDVDALFMYGYKVNFNDIPDGERRLDANFDDCFDYCKHDTADDGCCKTGECWYEQRLRELGIEVEE